MFQWPVLTSFRVFVDDIDVKGVQGGKAYVSYGIPPEGAVVIVRPDGYIGMIAPLDGVKDIDRYFAGFLKSVQ